MLTSSRPSLFGSYRILQSGRLWLVMCNLSAKIVITTECPRKVSLRFGTIFQRRILLTIPIILGILSQTSGNGSGRGSGFFSSFSLSTLQLKNKNKSFQFYWQHLHIIISQDKASPIFWADILQNFHQKLNHDERNLCKLGKLIFKFKIPIDINLEWIFTLKNGCELLNYPT